MLPFMTPMFGGGSVSELLAKAPIASGAGGPQAARGATKGGMPAVAPPGFLDRVGQAYQGFEGNFQNPLLQFGLNALAQSGPSVMPRSFGQIVGQAGGQTLQQQNRNVLMDAQRRLMESQIGRNEALAAGRPPEPQRRVAATKTLDNGNIGYVDAFTGEVVDTGAREGNQTKIVDIEGRGKHVFDPITSELIPLSSEEDVQDALGGRRAAETRGGEEAKAEVAAELSLPDRQAAANRLKGQISELLSHPGRSSATGALGVAPRIPGTEQAGFIDRLDQINAAAFLEAFQQLKGGGPITDREGEKATQAISRMKRTQSTAEFDAAAQELLDLIDEGVGISEQKASGEVFNRPTKRFNPETGQLEDM